MGRRKIEIKAIKDDRNRSVTFLKRKGGLFKKAHELSVLCNADIAVIIFGQNKKIHEFSSGDINEIIRKYQNGNEHKGLQDVDKNKKNLSDSTAPSQKPTEDLQPTAIQAPEPQQSTHTQVLNPSIHTLHVQERIDELKPPHFQQSGGSPDPQARPDQGHIDAQSDQSIEFSSIVPWYSQQEPPRAPPQYPYQELQLQSWLSNPLHSQLEASPLLTTPDIFPTIGFEDKWALTKYWSGSMNCLQSSRRPKLTVQIPCDEKCTLIKTSPPASVAAIGTQIYDYHSNELFPLLSSSYTLLSAGGHWPLENTKIVNTNNQDLQAPFSALLAFKSWTNRDIGDSIMLPSPLVFPSPLQLNRTEKKRIRCGERNEYSKKLKGAMHDGFHPIQSRVFPNHR